MGRTFDVLVEAHGELTGRTAKELRGPVSLARSYRDAPEVDGLVVVPGILPIGQLAQVRISGAMEYDLIGERVTARTSNEYE